MCWVWSVYTVLEHLVKSGSDAMAQLMSRSLGLVQFADVMISTQQITFLLSFKL